MRTSQKSIMTELSLKKFANWGIASAGLCLTAPDSGYRSPDEGCSLSDILETDVPSKYWLSEEMMRKIAATGMSDAQLYKQAGNAVTVNVVEAVAKFILEIEKEIHDGKQDSNICE